MRGDNNDRGSGGFGVMLRTFCGRLLCLFITIAGSALLAAQPTVKIVKLRAPLSFGTDCTQPFQQLTVTLDRQNIPPIADVQDTALWSVVLVVSKAGKLESQVISVTKVLPMKNGANDEYLMNGSLILNLSSAIADFPVQILVSLDYLNGASQFWKPAPAVVKGFGKMCPAGTPPLGASTPAPSAPGGTSAVSSTGGSGCRLFQGLGFFEAKKPAEEQMKLSGTWTAGYSTRPLYSIDAQIEIPVCQLKQFEFNIGGTIKTAERSSIDPDSFTSFVSFKPKSISGNGNNYRTWALKGGGEFSRKDQFENVVFGFQHTWGYGSYKSTSTGKLRYSYGYEIAAGAETGVNRRTKNFRSGYGTIGRLAPAATGILLFPMGSPARSLTLSTAYSPRILLSPEPFTDQRIWVAHQTPFKSFAKGTRHYWINQVNAELTPLLGLTAKVEFGSIPPAFNIIDFRFTTGITVKWKWKEQ